MGPLIARDALVTKWIDIEEKLEMLAGGKTNLTITQLVTYRSQGLRCRVVLPLSVTEYKVR